MKLSFVSALRESYQRWRARHQDPDSAKDAAITWLMDEHADLYARHQSEITRQWTAFTIIGGWTRKLKTPNVGRQLALDFGGRVECFNVPESVRFGGVEFPLMEGSREDWKRCVQSVKKLSISLRRLFAVIDPIFDDHPGITGGAAIEIAIERGRLREWRGADDDARAAG